MPGGSRPEFPLRLQALALAEPRALLEGAACSCPTFRLLRVKAPGPGCSFRSSQRAVPRAVSVARVNHGEGAAPRPRHGPGGLGPFVPGRALASSACSQAPGHSPASLQCLPQATGLQRQERRAGLWRPEPSTQLSARHAPSSGPGRGASRPVPCGPPAWSLRCLPPSFLGLPGVWSLLFLEGQHSAGLGPPSAQGDVLWRSFTSRPVPQRWP